MRRFHLVFGWWTLAAFLSLGIVLETMHGFKAALYLDGVNETRRLMWTLAHAHGTLFGLLHIAFSTTVGRLPDWNAKGASRSLVAGTILMPLGFLAGGAFIHDGDPGLGILLVPPGAILMLWAVVKTARAALAAPAE